jgi:hypothetical protein
MLMGRPILQFPLQEASRLSGDASLHATPGDAHHLADKIAELLDDPERAAALGPVRRESRR